eukprot:403332980
MELMSDDELEEDDYEFDQEDHNDREKGNPIDPLDQLVNALKSSTNQANGGQVSSGGTGGALPPFHHSHTQGSHSINYHNQQQDGASNIDRQSMFSSYTSQNGSFQIPQIMMGGGNQVGYYRGSEFSMINQKPEYFTVKINLQLKADDSHYQLFLSIPSSHKISDTIMHSLEHFNHKIKDYRLKMQSDLYALQKATTHGKIDENSPILHPSQNTFETGMDNFCLFFKTEEHLALTKKNKVLKYPHYSSKNDYDEEHENELFANQNVFGLRRLSTKQKFKINLPKDNSNDYEDQHNTNENKANLLKLWCMQNLLCCLWNNNSQNIQKSNNNHQPENKIKPNFQNIFSQKSALNNKHSNNNRQSLFERQGKKKEDYKKVTKKIDRDSFEEDYRYSMALLDKGGDEEIENKNQIEFTQQNLNGNKEYQYKS